MIAKAHLRTLIVGVLVFSALFFASAKDLRAEKTEPGHQLRLDLRSFYFKREKETPLPVSEALTQALMLRYGSPYLADRVGLKVSWFGNMKIIGEQGEGGTGLLQDTEDDRQLSYAKLAEAMLDFKLTADSELRLGRQVLFKPLLNDPDFRATPTSTQAGLVQYVNDQSEVYAVASDEGSTYTDTDFSPYTDAQGNQFNIYSLGFRHRFNNTLLLEAALGRADNVKDQAYLNIRYPWQINEQMSLLFDAYHYSGRANGDGALPGVGSDYRSDLNNLALHFAWLGARFTASYQKVNGDSYQLSWDGEQHDDTTYRVWQSVQRLNFDRAEEASWQVRFDYNFGGPFDGFWVMGRYISGDNIEREDGGVGSEWERDIDLMYSPPSIKGLSFRWRYAVVRSSETFDSDEHRLIVNYIIRDL